MKTVIQLLPTLADGGAETLVKEYALFIKKNMSEKCRVIILLIEYGNECANRRILKENNIPIYSLFNNKTLLGSFILRIIKHFWDVSFFSRSIFRFIAHNNPDVIHIHMSLLKYFEPIYNKLTNVKLFYTCHSIPSVYFSGNNIAEYRAAKKMVDEKRLLIFGLHDEMTNELNLLFETESCKTMPNAINYSLFENNRRDNLFIRRELGIQDDSFVIGNVGRFCDVKNQSFLVEVFARVRERKKNSKLVLIGNGAEKKKIEHKIEELGLTDSIIILSNRTDVFRLMQCFDVFVFPSKYEGFGIAVVEAQISHVPCIVSNYVPLSTKISHNFQVIELGSSKDEWAQAILNVNINNWEIDRKYDINLVINRLLKYYFGYVGDDK